MSDDSDEFYRGVERLAFERSRIHRSGKKFRRNVTRKIRRKKSKWRTQQQKRDKNLRMSQPLCAAVSVVGITDMELNNRESAYSSAFTEVSDWQKQHQIAYWKSRALSLEYENKMLHQHIKHVYAKQIVDYQNAQYVEEEQCEEEEVQCDEVMEQETVVREEARKEDRTAPVEWVGKKKKEEMVKLYGEMAPKILGMETAVQLNYDTAGDKLNPSYWPNLPLNFSNN